MTPYFQARAAYEAQRALQNALWKDPDQALPVAASHTIACDTLDSTVAPSGVRAAGIRNVLMRPQVSTDVRPEAWKDGVARIVGGQRLQLRPAMKRYSFPRHQAVERVYYLSAQDFLTLPLAALQPAAAAFASQVLDQADGLWISPILASDIQFRDAYAYINTSRSVQKLPTCGRRIRIIRFVTGCSLWCARKLKPLMVLPQALTKGRESQAAHIATSIQTQSYCNLLQPCCAPKLSLRLAPEHSKTDRLEGEYPSYLE